MATVLTIGGSTVNRVSARVTLDSMSLSFEDDEEVTFTELCVSGGPGSWSTGASCNVTIDGTLYFIGQITSAHPTPAGAGAINVTYTARGLRYLANLIPITAADGTGQMAWNLPQTDPDYLSTNAGKSLGQILTEVLNQHTTQLAAIGLTASPPYNASELAALTVVPNEPIVLVGRLIDAMSDLIAQWAPKYALFPSAIDGKIHIPNTLTLTATTLTLDSDLITLNSVSKSHGECYTRVTLRGAADIEGAYLSLADGTLAWHDTAGQSTWTLNDFLNPKTASDHGTITAMSSTTLTVQSSDTAKTWATNFWSGKGGVVWAINTVGTGLAFTEQARITANTSLSAGGTSVLTLDHTLANSGYTTYQIRGNRDSKSLVWRELDIVPTWVAQHLARRFSHSVPWSPSDGILVQTTSPIGVVCWSQNGSPPFLEFPIGFEIVLYDGTTNGRIILYQPAPMTYTSQAALLAGGSAVQGPDDIKVVVPYSRGTLTATKPTSSYEGTAYTVDGIQRTLFLDYPQWLDKGDNANMLLLAQEVLDSVKDTVIEGQITIHDKALTWLTLGKSVHIARQGGTTGWEALAAPVKSVTFNWQSRASNWSTHLRFSTRRRPFTGDRLYAPQMYSAQGFAYGEIAAGTYAGMTQPSYMDPAAAMSAYGQQATEAFGGDRSLGMPDYLPDWATRGEEANTYRGPQRDPRVTRGAGAEMGETLRKFEQQQIDMDEVENRKRAAQTERAQIAERNRAKEEDQKRQVSDRDIDEHLHGLAEERPENYQP